MKLMKLMKRRMERRTGVEMMPIAHISIPLNSFDFINTGFIDLKIILQNNC